jgi:acyl-CoA synthetase (AMP-forming)/AMP-acid ligase II/acyl carrier protein
MLTVPTTIPALLALQALAEGSRTALAAADGGSLTYAELAATIDRLGTTALGGRGIDRTCRLAVVLPNGLDLAIGLLTASSAAIAVPLAPTATPDEYRVWFQAGRVSHLLTCAQAAPAARDVAVELGLPVMELTHRPDGYHLTGGSDSAPSMAATRPPSPADVAVVLMTSGSTGTPKRVPLTHANLLAGARSVAAALELGPADRVLVMWEQYHVGGLVDLLLAPLVGGGAAVCAGGFDTRRFFDLLDVVRPTWFQGVPTTLRELLVHVRLAGRLPVASTLRLLRSVAAPLPSELMRELETTFGVPVIQTFGMTEAAPLITTNRLPPGSRKPGSTGTPCGCDVAVLDAAGEPLPTGTTGEVAVRGPNVFAGYEDDPETNARVFRRGWFLTGDVGRFDAEGFLFLTGRVKEMINRGGEKIAPAEVEEAAARHPAVAQAAAFAIPHATLGEDVGLAVVPRDGEPVDRDKLRAHLATQLSRFKLPAVVLVLDELPRCPIGKVRRRELAALATAPSITGCQPAPRSELGDLAAVWAGHLDLPAVDPDADFQILGGDSLSRIRLVIAVESLCGVSFPEDVAATLTTVRRMAAEISRLGGRVPPVASAPASGEADASADLWGDGDAATLADAPPEKIRDRLAGCRSLKEFEAVRENLLNLLTLDELVAVVDRPRTLPMAWAASRVARLPWRRQVAEPAQAAAALTAWRAELRAAAAIASRPRWLRERLAPTALLYRRQAKPATGRRLIVGFAGNQQRLMLPTHAILDHLPPHDDLLLLFDPDRQHFAAGARGIAATLPAVCEWLAARLADWDYGSIVTFGTSAGGLAAIGAAHAVGSPRAVAVGADLPSDHPPLERFLLEQFAAATSRPPTVILAYDPANRRDRAGSEALATLVPTACTTILTASGSHNTLRPALAAGRLAPLLHDLLGLHSRAPHDDRAAA